MVRECSRYLDGSEAKVKELTLDVVVQFERGMRILRVIHGRDARATSNAQAAEPGYLMIRIYGWFRSHRQFLQVRTLRRCEMKPPSCPHLQERIHVARLHL